MYEGMSSISSRVFRENIQNQVIFYLLMATERVSCKDS